MIFRISFVLALFYNLDINKMYEKIIVLYSLINYLIYIKIKKNIEIKTNKNIIYKLLKA